MAGDDLAPHCGASDAGADAASEAFDFGECCRAAGDAAAAEAAAFNLDRLMGEGTAAGIAARVAAAAFGGAARGTECRSEGDSSEVASSDGFEFVDRPGTGGEPCESPELASSWMDNSPAPAPSLQGFSASGARGRLQPASASPGRVDSAFEDMQEWAEVCADEACVSESEWDGHAESDEGWKGVERAGSGACGSPTAPAGGTWLPYGAADALGAAAISALSVTARGAIRLARAASKSRRGVRHWQTSQDSVGDKEDMAGTVGAFVGSVLPAALLGFVGFAGACGSSSSGVGDLTSNLHSLHAIAL